MARLHQSLPFALITAIVLAVVMASSNARSDDLRSLRDDVRRENPKTTMMIGRRKKRRRKIALTTTITTTMPTFTIIHTMMTTMTIPIS